MRLADLVSQMLNRAEEIQRGPGPCPKCKIRERAVSKKTGSPLTYCGPCASQAAREWREKNRKNEAQTVSKADR